MQKKFVFSLFIFILAFQLVSLRPSFLTFKDSSWGNIITINSEIEVRARKIFTEATLSSASTIVHDSIVFTGDVMLGRNVETLMNINGSDYPYKQFNLRALSNSPAVLGNFESSMAFQHQQTPANVLRFSVAAKFLPEFGANFTHASLANNHSLDYGEDGYLNAVTLLEQNSLNVFGHNTIIDNESISYLNTVKGKVSLVGINASQHIPKNSEIKSVCETAKRQSDFQIAYIHWGNEYEPLHSEAQRLLAEVLIDSCADLIIGHHPHVVQDVDVIKGVLVFYSLGNYVFDQYFSSEVKEGLVVVLQFSDIPTVQLIPVSSAEVKSSPAPMETNDAQNFLMKLASRSHPSLRSAIEQSQIGLLEPVATSTKMAIMWR